MEKNEGGSPSERNSELILKHFNSNEKNESNEDNSGKNENSDKDENKSSGKKGGTTIKTSNLTSVVIAHYDELGSCTNNNIRRDSCRIVYLRNFNNWIKCILINKGVSYLHQNNIRNFKVLDMCCGRGGDFIKWLTLNAKYIIFSDISEASLEQCKSRIKTILRTFNRSRSDFDCEFIPADCTRVRLREKFQDPSICLDIVSCQFSFHYCFESLPQAECMLKNASECLKPGGLFIGTLPNANEIVKRIRKSGTNSFENEVFKVEMQCSEPYPLFGAQYYFYLKNVVDCPEFLVHFPTFERLANKFNLKLISRQSLPEFFNNNKGHREHLQISRKMKAFEIYPPFDNVKLMGPEGDYIHARVFCDGKKIRVGTISRSEWEVISLYQIFIFQKVKTI